MIIEVSDQNSNRFLYLFLLVGRSKEPGDHGSRQIPKRTEVAILLRDPTKDESQIHKIDLENLPQKKLVITVGQASAKLLRGSPCEFPLIL